jgi:hypothetical protein
MGSPPVYFFEAAIFLLTAASRKRELTAAWVAIS